MGGGAAWSGESQDVGGRPRPRRRPGVLWTAEWGLRCRRRPERKSALELSHECADEGVADHVRLSRESVCGGGGGTEYLVLRVVKTARLRRGTGQEAYPTNPGSCGSGGR